MGENNRSVQESQLVITSQDPEARLLAVRRMLYMGQFPDVEIPITGYYRAVHGRLGLFLECADGHLKTNETWRAAFVNHAIDLYEGFEAFYVRSGKDPLIKETMDALRGVYPRLFEEMDKVKEEGEGQGGKR
jgi:hypothetical protein